MVTTTVEEIIAQVKALSADEKQRFTKLLRTEVFPSPNGQGSRHSGPSPALRWLHEHAREYIGEWVALDGDRLICHDKDHRVVFAAAKAAREAGIEKPLVHLVYDPSVPFMGGWL